MNDERLGWKILRWENAGSYVLAAAVLGVAIFLGEEFAHHIDRFENWLAGLGPWAYIIAIVLYALCASIFIPDTLLGIAAGAAFGFTGGVIVALCGSLLAASAQYPLARHMLKPFIDRKLASKPSMTAIQHAVRQEQLKLQLLIRLTPINRAVTSYVVSAAGVRFPGYLLACAGFLPHLCLEVYLGYAGKHLARISGQSGYNPLVHDTMMLAGLVLAALAIYTISKTAKKALEEAAGKNPGLGIR